MTRTVEVTLKFNARDLQELLDAANLGDEGALQLDDMTISEFGAFAAALKDSAQILKEEVVETAYDACANDWLYGFDGDRR